MIKRQEVAELPNNDVVCECGSVMEYEGTDVGRNGAVEIYVCPKCEALTFYHEEVE